MDFDYASHPVVAGGRVFFVSYDGQGSALRVTDGTSTTRVKALTGSWNPSSDQVVAMGEKLFFFLGLELWVSDGTPEKTFPVTQLTQAGDYLVNLVAGDLFRRLVHAVFPYSVDTTQSRWCPPIWVFRE